MPPIAFYNIFLPPPNQDKLSFADELLINNASGQEGRDSFFDFRFIVPTSNSFELVFSECRLALTDYRKASSPQLFEEQMFLHINCAFWSISDVNDIIR